MHDTRSTHAAGERGFVTAEAAVVLPSLSLVLTLCVGVVMTVGAQLKCLDAARETVRLAARGESAEVAEHAGSGLAPEGARITLVNGRGWVEARVRAQVKPFGLLPGLPLGATARAAREGA